MIDNPQMEKMEESTNLTFWRGVMGLAVAGAMVGAVLAVSIFSPNKAEGCIDDTIEAEEIQADIQAPLEEIQRRLRAQERALRLLDVDRRWRDPAQHRWLAEAMAQTRVEIARLRAAADQKMSHPQQISE